MIILPRSLLSRDCQFVRPLLPTSLERLLHHSFPFMSFYALYFSMVNVPAMQRGETRLRATPYTNETSDNFNLALEKLTNQFALIRKPRRG